MKLIDERTSDGSRHFAKFPQITGLQTLHDHLLSLGDAEVVNYVEAPVGRPWFDFKFRGHRFLVHNVKGQFLLFVCDPQCPDLILFEVGCHFEQLFVREKQHS